ncbi:MAG: N-ATPase subunit AtpR [Desulfuromonadales bacterium]
MNEAVLLVLAWLAGGVIGFFFFGGLWWTVRKGLSAKQPALWFFASLLVRMGIALTGFYFVSNLHFDRLMVCLLGFFIARMVVMRLTRTPEKPTSLTEKASHAP